MFQVLNAVHNCAVTLKYRDSCEVSCVEGFENKNTLAGKLFCLDNGRWIGEETVCAPKDCGSPHNVSCEINIISSLSIIALR